MEHLDLAAVLTTPPQWNLPGFEQQDAIYLSSSRQMLEPIMEETSDDEEYGLNSWQQYEQQSSDVECGGTTEGESVCEGTGGAGGASFWSSAESDTGSVIRVEVNKDNDSTSERDFLCPAKRPRRCEESLMAQSLNEDEVILRRPLYAELKNNSLERFLNYENVSRDSWGANSQQRSSVGSRRGFDDFYSDSDSLSYNSLSRSSSLIQFESLERQLLMHEQHASINSLGNSSPSLLSFETNEDTAAKAASSSGNNSANNSRRGSQSSLLKKYESLDGRLHQTYYDLDKLNFDDMNNSNSDNFPIAANLKISSHMAELRSDSESSSEGSESNSRPQSVLSPSDSHDNDFLMKKFNRTNSQQQIKKGKNSAENLSEDSGYCEPSLGFGLRRSKSQSLLTNYEKFSEEEEEMENKSLPHTNNKAQTFIELNVDQQVNNKHSITNEFKNITTRQETIKSPPLSPHLEFIRHKQRTEAHSPSPVSSEVSTSSSTSSQSTNSNSSHNSSSSSSASSTSSATTCASKASFTWLMPSAIKTIRQSTSSSRVLAEEEKSPSQISINDLRELQTSNEENVQVFSGKLKNIEKISRVEYLQVVSKENACFECKNILELNECRNCGENLFSKYFLKQENLYCQKCKEHFNCKERIKNFNETAKGNSENVLNCENFDENLFVDSKLASTLNAKVRKQIFEQQPQLLADKSVEFVDTEINESNCLNEFVLDYDSSVSTPESIKRGQSCENSTRTLRKYKNFNSSCTSTPDISTHLLKAVSKTCPLTFGCSASSDSDYSPSRLRKNSHNLMPSWPVKTTSVPTELNTIGRKKKLRKAKTGTSSKPLTKNKQSVASTDKDSVSSSDELDFNSLNLKRSLSWSFQQNLELETPSLCLEPKNLGLLHQSYHNLALLSLEFEQDNCLANKMAERRISSDYETEIVCKNNFLLDELSAHFDRTASILTDKPADETDAVIIQPPKAPPRRKTSNSSFSATEDSENEQVQHVSLVLRKPPSRQKRDKVEEKTNSLTQDYSFASIMQSGGKTFDQDPTILKTSYAQSLEKCNFDCRELSTQDLNKARAMPKRRFQSQANSSKKKNLVSSTPNLNAYDFKHQDDIEDDMFVSSAHTSMHQLPLSQAQKPLGILIPAGSRTSFGKEVSFCPVVSKYCWQEQSSEECNDGNEESLEGEDESEDELLDNADATVIYNTKENENIASKYSEEFLKKDVQENIFEEPKKGDEMIKEKTVLKETNTKQQVENVVLTKENTERDQETDGNETQQREDQTSKSKINKQDNNETEEQEELSELLITATQSSSEPPVTTVSLTTNVNNETLKTQTDSAITEQNKRVNNYTNTSSTPTKPTVVVARPLSIQLPILSEPPINRAHHILYASQQMLDNFQKQQENEEYEHFKSQSTQNLSKMSAKPADLQQQATSNSKLNNNNEIMKSKFKHEEKHPNSKGFLSRFANGFRFSLRRNKKKLQQKESHHIEGEQQEQNKTNGQANQNKTKSLPAAHKQVDFIHIPLKGPLPDNRNGNTKAQTNGNSANNGNAKNATVLLKQKGAKTKDTNDKQQKVTGKPPIPPQQQQIQQLQKMQSAQSSLQQQQLQPLFEVGLSRFYTETESHTAPHPHSVTQDFLTSERGLYNENHNQQQFTTSSQSCANNQLLTSAENDTKMTAVNTNNTSNYEFTSPSRATVSQKTQMFNNLSRKSEQPKIGLIETNLDTHETIITGKTRSLINIGPNQQQQQRYAGNKRLHANINSPNHHQQQYAHHHLDGNEADDDEYDDNDDDEVVVRPDGTVVVIKNAGTGGSSSSQAAQIVSVRRPHKSMEFLLDKENQKDVMAQFKNGDEGENRNTEKATTSQQTRSGIAESPSTSNNITSSLRQPVLKTCLSNVQSYASGGSKHQKLTQSIMEMIVTDNLPFSHVEGKGFRKFMKINCPLYAVPCRNTVKAYMEKTYETEAKNFKTKLSEIPNMCLTTDIWTDTEMNSMLGVTVHGLFGSNQFSGTIGVFKLTEAHTAVHISEILEESLLEFSINKENVMAIVTDNGANIVKAIHDTFGKRRHIPCFAHTLNLVCENALNTPEVADVISKCKAIVTWFKRSVKANDDLRRLQSRAGIPQGKMLKPIMDVKTRWNSTYYMLDRFLKLISYISQILLNYYDAPPMITTKNKEEIEELVQLLRPLEAMTSQISGEKYATLSHIIPLTHCGRLQIHKMHCVCPVANKVKETILAQFNRRFGEIEHSFLVAASTLLDPRFKKIHFQDPLAVSKVMRHLRKEMDEIPTEDSIGSSSEASSTGELEFDLWAPHKNLAHKRRRKDDESTQDELSFYLNAPVLELKRNVPDAWEEMKSVYPKLYIIAQKYCFLVGTSVPAERLFSKAGATATEKRNRLTTKRLSKLLFFNSVFNNTQ